MEYVCDLHLHSKYSRAVSPSMNLETMAFWATKKGLNVLSTGDWTHPMWIREIKQNLEEAEKGLFRLKSDKASSMRFLLSVEISSIYSQGGQVRRIHNLIFSPSIETSEKINQELVKRGCNLGSDGRPIIGLSSIALCELVFSIDKEAMIIPAHCLTPDSFIHTKEGVKQIKDIAVGDLVYTHKNRAKKVSHVFKRHYKGDLYDIRPWYFSLGLATTSEHPFYAFRVNKCSVKGGRCIPTPAHKKICKDKIYQNYKPQWIFAESLRVGDVLVYPRFQNTTLVTQFPLDHSNQFKTENGSIYTGGTRGHVFPQKLSIDKNFCRLIGYYLAEGYTNGRDEIGFTFHRKEKLYVKDVISLMKDVFGISHYRIYKRKDSKSIEISFYSRLLVVFFTKHFYEKSPYRATTKIIPDWILHLPEEMQAELLRGWWRGDDGYTSSRQLMNGMKIICLRLGIIPSISKDTKDNHFRRGNHQYYGRLIKATSDYYIFSNLAFFDDLYGLQLDPAFNDSIRKISRRHGWIDKNYIYIPIREIIKSQYSGKVFNLEVDEDNSYISEFAAVHNCWTPWFSMYGSKSGFDLVKDCFGEYADKIYGVETGLSSDPYMNWQIKDLETRSILSFSDAHSPAKMGREATVFMTKDGLDKKITFKDICEAIQRKPDANFKIGYTIEFYPEEGKYHYTGHRNCNYFQTPDLSRKEGTLCPVCKRPLTVGVMHRVEDLAKNGFAKEVSKLSNSGVKWILDPNKRHPPFVKLVPLNEIIAQSLNSTVASLKVKDLFDMLCLTFGSEINILLKVPISDIAKIAGERVGEGIGKVRKGDIDIHPGYDGLYGVVKIWKEEDKKEQNNISSQLGIDF